MATPRIAAFAGSTRFGSFNRKLLGLGITALQAAGAEVTQVDLRDLAMPLYDGNLEASQGLPPGAKAFKSLLVASHGFLIACPEYNSGYSAVLKNAIDWASRSEAGETGLMAFAGKTAALMGASTGMSGAQRSMGQLRWVLGNIGVMVIPEQVSITKAAEAFDEQGQLRDQALRTRVEKAAGRLAEVTRKLIG